MRAISAFVMAALIGLSQPALAECVGKYPNIVCFSDSGDVWTPQGYYSGFSSSPSGGSKIARYPNAAATRPDSEPAENSDTSGEMAVLQPSTQSGNAWVLTPQSSGGATVLGRQGAGGP
jgi:hypothetical protein